MVKTKVAIFLGLNSPNAMPFSLLAKAMRS